ncbi:high-affinity nicotinic acid transporter [Grosmannia clavigera kw1407]|uniref:High-affinity nicotinic acid transporter n=1 Tax=Grosmannia clavigera (strain kw1407 / UAMH 11150) TaxID=655863 RepID=F0XBG2_GROCL|nr:high-affinity nicotinic acid transporter [Grosmannia clavigera kw1407]EFX04879.1 high-affinity nicotinic acid transporter [Grosmannia clavigera kw1407]
MEKHAITTDTTLAAEISQVILSPALERAYVRKMDLWLLPFLSAMYFFNSIDRSNLANAQTDGMGKDLHLVGEQYSLLVLLFYIPNGLFDLPLNLLTKHFSGRTVLPVLMTGWGAMSLIQVGCRSFASMLVVRLILSVFEAGFFAGTVFYLTLFCTRGELGFRIALYFGSALLAGAFSGVLAFGVFQIDDPHVKGWQWLFIIEGGMTVLFGLAAFLWLPASPQTAWFLSADERAVASQRSLRDGSSAVGERLDLQACLATWREWQFALWCVISFTYPVAFATTANFLPLVLRRLGYSTVKTNLLTVPPNVAGFVVLLAVTYSSDRRRERTFHIIGSLLLSLAGLIILVAIDAEAHRAVAYFSCFLLCSGAYIPSCLVHSWHNNNNLRESSRAATTGLLVGLGNIAGILSAATFRTQYAPRYAPTLIATACCNVVCIVFTLWLGLWMRAENGRRDQAQGVRLSAEQVDTQELEGVKDSSIGYTHTEYSHARIARKEDGGALDVIWLGDAMVHDLILPALEQVGKRGGHLGADVAGADGVDTDAVLVQLGGDGRDHGADAALGGAVGRRPLGADGHVGGDAGDENDAAALGAVGDHLLSGQLGGEVDALDVDAEQALEVGGRGVEELDVLVDAGTGDQDVETAVEVGLELGEAGLESLVRGNVDLVGLGLNAILGGDLGKAGDRVEHVKDGHIGAGFGETLGKGQTTATSTTGHEGHAAFERELGCQRASRWRWEANSPWT